MTHACHPPLDPCPFCGAAAIFREIRYTGAHASGMEPPSLTCGCPHCGIWLPQQPTRYHWRENGAVDWLKAEADVALMNRWNTRVESAR